MEIINDQENIIDKCDFPWYATRKHCITILFFYDFLIEILITMYIYLMCTLDNHMHKGYCRFLAYLERLFPVTRNQEVFLEVKGRGLTLAWNW